MKIKVSGLYYYRNSYLKSSLKIWVHLKKYVVHNGYSRYPFSDEMLTMGLYTRNVLMVNDEFDYTVLEWEPSPVIH